MSDVRKTLEQRMELIDRCMPSFWKEGATKRACFLDVVAMEMEAVVAQAKAQEREANDKILTDMLSESPAYERGVRDGGREGYADGVMNESYHLQGFIRRMLQSDPDLSHEARECLQQVLQEAKRAKDRKELVQARRSPLGPSS